jgi:hypothetical protein
MDRTDWRALVRFLTLKNASMKKVVNATNMAFWRYGAGRLFRLLTAAIT